MKHQIYVNVFGPEKFRVRFASIFRSYQNMPDKSDQASLCAPFKVISITRKQRPTHPNLTKCSARYFKILNKGTRTCCLDTSGPQNATDTLHILDSKVIEHLILLPYFTWKQRPEHLTNLVKRDVKSIEIMKKGVVQSSLDTAGPKRAPEIENGHLKHAKSTDVEVRLGARIHHKCFQKSDMFLNRPWITKSTDVL